MFPYNFVPYPTYGSPSYNSSDAEYLRTLAEEQAARQAYTDAVRAQADARARAARAHRARQTYERAHSAYLSDEDEDLGNGFGYSPRGQSSYFIPPERALFQEQQRRELEQQRRREALELERARERERIQQLEEEQRRRLLEEERRRRMLLEEELRRQKETEEREQEEMRRRLQEEYLRRQSLSPLEQLLGLRPSRSMQSEQPHSHRARTTSPPTTRREPSAQPAQRSPSQHARTPSSAMPGNHPHSPSPVPVRKAPTPPRTSTPPRPAPTPEQISAATKIQETWRTHDERRKALASITRISTTFEASKAACALPATLDYQQTPTDISQYISVPTVGVELNGVIPMDVEEPPEVPKLAFTPTNAPVHVYEEELNRMLTQLDEVQSGGDVEVRSKRRELARKIEREAERIEWMKVAVWKAWEAKQKDAEAKESTAEETAVAQAVVPEEMEVDHTATPASESSQSTVAASLPTSEPQFELDTSEPMAEESVLVPVPVEAASEAEIEETEEMLSEELPATVEDPAESLPVGHPPESTSPPSLVDTQSEAGETETSLRTPVLEHIDLQTEPTVENVPMQEEEAQPHPQAPAKVQTTAELLSSLYPLYNQDWDDVDGWDLF